MLLNIPKIVKTFVPLEKQASMQSWLQTWFPPQAVVLASLTSTIAFAAPTAPILMYGATLTATLGASQIIKGMGIKRT